MPLALAQMLCEDVVELTVDFRIVSVRTSGSAQSALLRSCSADARMPLPIAHFVQKRRTGGVHNPHLEMRRRLRSCD